MIDTYEKNYPTHFFGSIVYVTSNNAVANEYLIIDGQQRLTTVSLLLLAIRDYLVNNKIKSNINPKKIMNAYLIDEYDEDDKIKLKLVQDDSTVYDKLISGYKADKDSCLTINYKLFYNKLENMNIVDIEGLYNSIMKLIIVNVSLNPSDGDDPQLIFESLNSTGMALEESDKIRNYILMNMPAKEQAIIYKRYWQNLENLVSRDDMTKFIRYYIAVKTNELNNEKKLYFPFKYYRESNNLQIEDLLKDMVTYAEFYNTIKSANSKDKNSKPYEIILERINKLDVSTTIPLIFNLMKAFTDNELTENELTESLSTIESYIVRRTICGLPANRLNKMFSGVGAEIRKYIERDNVKYIEAFNYAILNKSGRSRFPNNHELHDNFADFELYNVKSSFRKYFLERLENYGNKAIVDVESLVDKGILTIEHIMPQTLSNEWKNSLGSNWELIHTKYKDTVGNLTLSEYNSDYSNLSFVKKKDMQDKGFNKSKLTLNDYIKTCDKWDESTILTRAQIMYTKAEKIWSMPKSEYSPDSSEEWNYWDDDFDYTNKTITKIKILGDEINTENITDAYKKINSILYDLDPIAFKKMPKEYICYNYSDLATPYEISSGIYIEINLSSQSKIDKIKRLATCFEFESKDIQYLVKPKTQKKEFDIRDEETYYNIKVGKLAYEFISDLVKRNKISSVEINKLKTKEFSRKFISKINYPFLADSVDSNRGNSIKNRYRKEGIKFNNSLIYVTVELFDSDREELILWYKSHI